MLKPNEFLPLPNYAVVGMTVFDVVNRQLERLYTLLIEEGISSEQYVELCSIALKALVNSSGVVDDCDEKA